MPAPVSEFVIDRPVVKAKPAPRFVKASTKADYGDSLEGQSANTYDVGDHVVLLNEQGAPSLYHINSIDPSTQVCDLQEVDSDLNPTGNLLQRALPEDSGLGLNPSHFAALQPLYLSNEGGADDYSVKTDANDGETKGDVTQSKDPAKFAYVPDKNSPSTWKLPIGDAKHIKLAWQAVTKGVMGQTAQVKNLDAVKAKIRAAANALPDGDDKKAVLAYINGKSASGSNSSKTAASTQASVTNYNIGENANTAAPANAPETETKAVATPDDVQASKVAPNVNGSTPSTPIRERNIAAKSVSADGWRIGGYLVLWGDRHLTDLTGDWFTKNTDFKLDWYDKRPYLYEHGQDSTVEATKVGVIDTLEPDDDGLWMEAQLDRANKYAKRVKELVAKGKLGLSSGSLAHIVKRRGDAPRGEITEWPIGEGSGTVTPAEPRTLAVPIKHYTDAATLETAYKSINLSADRWTEADSQDATAHPDQESPDGSHATEANENGQATNDGIAMTENTVKSLGGDLVNEQEMATIAKLVVEAMAGKAQTQAAATPADEPKATKALPASNPLPVAAPSQPETKSMPRPAYNTRVIGDRRFADFSAEDMSFLAQMYEGIEERHTLRRITASRKETLPLEAAAKNFRAQLTTDPEHKLERLISHKVLRGIAENRLDSNLVEFLPFRDMDAVEGNHYDISAAKFAQEEMLVARMADAGKTTQEIKSAVETLRADNAIKSNELDNTAQTSFGAEWVPTIWNSDAWRKVRINNPVAGLITNVQMPSSPWNWPIESTDPTVYFVGEGTDASMLVLGTGNQLALSKAGTSKVAFTAKKLGSHIGFSVEENEDSIIPIIPIWRYQMTRALWNYVDDTIINGDTTTSASTNINLIDSTPASGTSYLAFDGMRKYALITNTAQLVDFGNAFPSMANIRKMQTLLAVQYQADFQNLGFVTNVGTYQRMKSMPEFASYLNVGVMPPQVTGLLPNGSSAQATMGQVNPPAAPVGVIDGIPLYVSAQIGLSKSGAIGSNGGEISNTGANNVNGSILLFHRTRCVLGWRRAITSDVLATSVFSDTYQLWSTCRIAFNTFDTQSIVLGYDIAQ